MNNELTSIIILTYNNLLYSQMCLDSIRQFTPSKLYEIIIVDNHSTDGTIEWLHTQNDIRIIANNENLGFSKRCNQGIELAQGKNILFLHNDVIVTPNWLENLTVCLNSSEDIGAVGPVTNSCYTQEIPFRFQSINELVNFTTTYNLSDQTMWDERLDLSSFCFLIKRQVIDTIGYFDELFSHGYFEDKDYSFRIRKSGCRLYLCRDTYVHHFGYNTADNSINEKPFYDKWGFAPYYSTQTRNEIIDLIGSPKSSEIAVLDIGCACGATLLQIKNIFKKASLYGVELNAAAAEFARIIAKVSIQDVESQDLEFPEHFFDYIIFADVLEHLKNPWKVLLKIKKHLKEGGKILASIPNIMHFSIIQKLLNGNWHYEENGILDKTHLRFFALDEIKKMFLETGYDDLSITEKVLAKSEEDKEFLKRLLTITKPELVPQFEAFQYLVKASML